MTDRERWEDVPGYEGLYSISSLGRVRSHSPKAAKLQDGILKQTIGSRTGHRYSVRLSKGGVQKTWEVHKLVAAVFIGPKPDGMEICHKDGNKANNSVHNLKHGTHAENMEDMRIHGSRKFSKCKRGHDLVPGNLYYYSGGGRSCKACCRWRRINRKKVSA